MLPRGTHLEVIEVREETTASGKKRVRIITELRLSGP
jgi:hypothetical protein